MMEQRSFVHVHPLSAKLHQELLLTSRSVSFLIPIRSIRSEVVEAKKIP